VGLDSDRSAATAATAAIAAAAGSSNWRFDSGAAYSAIPTPPAALPIQPAVKVVCAPNHMNEIICVLRKARRSIAIGAYSLDHTDILANLEHAVKRGVDIKLLIDQTYLFKSTCKNTYDFLETLLTTYQMAQKARVAGTLEIRAFKPQSRRLTVTREGYGAQLHAKFGIVDDAIGWLGSCNLTTNSASWFEMISIIADPAAITAMREGFDEWWSLDEHAVIGKGCALLANHQYRSQFSR